MNIVMRFVVVILLTGIFGCTDGSQVSQHIIGIVDERNGDKLANNDVHFLSVEFAGTVTTYKVDQDSNTVQSIIDGQFLVMDDLSVNLAGVRAIYLSNDTLNVNF